jgi:hypothetical protein
MSSLSLTPPVLAAAPSIKSIEGVFDPMVSAGVKLNEDGVNIFLDALTTARLTNDPQVNRHSNFIQKYKDLLFKQLNQTEILGEMAKDPFMLKILEQAFFDTRRWSSEYIYKIESFGFENESLCTSVIDSLLKSQSDLRRLIVLKDLAFAMLNENTSPGGAIALESAAEKNKGTPSIRLDSDTAKALFEALSADKQIVTFAENKLKFSSPHLQAIFTARALIGIRDSETAEFLSSSKIYTPEGKDIALLLADILYFELDARFNFMITQIIEGLGPNPTEDEECQCFKLLKDIETHIQSRIGPTRQFTLNYERYCQLKDKFESLVMPKA